MQQMTGSHGAYGQVPFYVLDCVNYIRGDRYGYYRILVAHKAVIKYLRFPSNLTHQIPDVRGWRLAFETVPHGSWNCATLALHPADQKYHIASTRTVTLPSITRWYDKCIDLSTLPEATFGPCDDVVQCQSKPMSSIRPCTAQSRSRPCPPAQSHDSVFVDYTWWPSDMYGPEKETRIHSRIRDHQIAPRFLAHVTENNSRVIGYMTEHVPGRVAEPSDLAACQKALAKLHRLGIAYGDLSADGFIIADDVRRGVLLHSFGAARETTNKEVFRDEMDQLKAVLDADARRRRRERRGNRM